MADGQNRTIAQDLDDVQAFPLLTSEVNQVNISRPTSGTNASIGQLADLALREVLSVRPTLNDPKGFVAALNNAFSVTEVDGRTQWAWTPHSYAVQADMGAVTGAQASIYARAKAALDQAVPLLDGLYPLRADADIEDVDSMRAIVRSGMIELVNELGTVGGPRPQRVDAIFESLLGPRFTQTDEVEAASLIDAIRSTLEDGTPSTSDDEPIEQMIGTIRTSLRATRSSQNDPEQVNGLLGTIRDRFGLERARVNTIEEEQNLTNYFILVDQVIALKLSWNAQRHYFDRVGSDVFLGTQLVQLSRALAVVAESVQEAEFVMDSVFLGPAERQTLELPLDHYHRDETRLTIDELLKWVEQVALEEGPRVIREAGKDGVVSLTPTIERLHNLISTTVLISQSNGTARNPTRGFHTPRVQRAMQELQIHLKRAQDLTSQIHRQPSPLISSVYPSHASQDTPVRLSIDGSNFQPGATAHLNESGPSDKRILGRDVTVVSKNEIKATFDLSSTKPGSVWTVVVKNLDTGTTAKQRAFTVDALQVAAAPTLTIITPNRAAPGETLSVTLEGSGFQSGATCSFGVDQLITIKTGWVSQAELMASVIIDPSTPPGPYIVTVTNPDSRKVPIKLCSP